MAFTDNDPGFTIIPPENPRHPAVIEFYAQHPEFSVQSSLEFLTGRYPNTSRWVIDGGVAVQSLVGHNPERQISVLKK